MKKLRVLFIASFLLIAPGQIYGAVEFQGNVVISDKELSSSINPALDMTEIAARIKSAYYDLGYFEAQVFYDSTRVGRDSIIVIDEGKPYRLSRIDIEIAPDSLKSLLAGLLDTYNGRVVARVPLNEFAKSSVDILAEHGMPFARGEWTSFGIDENRLVNAAFRVIPGPLTVISDIEFKGIKRTRPGTLEKAAGLKTGTLYSESKVSRAQSLLERLRYIEISSPYSLETSSDGDSCTVIYNIRELPSTRIEGVAGYVNVQGKRDFIGKADLEFGDILGTGRSFGLLWNKKDSRSNELRIKYGEKFVLNSRIDLELEAYQIDRDTLYITTGGKAQFSHDFGTGLLGSLRFSIERTVPETGSSVSNSIKRSVGTEFLYNKTDFFPNPRSGYEIGSQMEYRYRSNREVLEGQDPPSDITSAGAKGALYIGISRKLVAAAMFQGWGIVSANGTVPVDDYRFIGGANDLRGYTEQRFPAYRYLILTLEPRLITGRYNRAYLFGDLGIIKGPASGDTDYSYNPGYGLGLVSRSAIGQLKVEIGWGEEGFPSEAVFNFGIIGSF